VRSSAKRASVSTIIAFARAVDARDLVGAFISVVILLAYGDGFGGALDAGFRGAFSDGTVVAWPGRRACRPAASVQASVSG